jgi:DNA-binding CsgD family transcriptional regulator
MKPSVVLANLRQIATLDAPAEVCLPDLIEILRAYVYFDFCVVNWTDERHKLAAIWQFAADMGASTRASALYHDRYYNRREQDEILSTGALLQGSGLIDNCARYGDRFFDTEIYHTVVKPAGSRHVLRLVMRDANRPVGFLILTRRDKPFSTDEERRLIEVHALLCHSVAKDMEIDATALVPSSKSATLICDMTGVIHHMTGEAQQFLCYIFAPDSSISDMQRTFAGQARQWLMPLIRSLVKSPDSPFAPPPALYRQNKWGGFSARGYRLFPLDGMREDLVQVALTQHVPLSLRLMQLPAVRDLPRREKEVCILLAEGRTVPEIADRLDVSVPTISGHVTSIYLRFGVNSREKLILALLTGY